jgi:TonB family protein
MQFTRVQVAPPPQAAKPPPPPPTPQPQKVVETPSTRVDLKPMDLPPEAPRPAAPAAGPLALAEAAEGPGDGFNLAGNPGGRGLLSGGGLGDGTGTGLGGEDDLARRFGWYYARIASEIEETLRRNKQLTTASVRVELRVWADASGRIERVQLVQSTGRPDLEAALQSVVGLRLKEPPPPDLPMPMIARFTARRPQ